MEYFLVATGGGAMDVQPCGLELDFFSRMGLLPGRARCRLALGRREALPHEEGREELPADCSCREAHCYPGHKKGRSLDPLGFVPASHRWLHHSPNNPASGSNR